KVSRTQRVSPTEYLFLSIRIISYLSGSLPIFTLIAKSPCFGQPSHLSTNSFSLRWIPSIPCVLRVCVFLFSSIACTIGVLNRIGFILSLFFMTVIIYSHILSIVPADAAEGNAAGVGLAICGKGIAVAVCHRASGWYIRMEIDFNKPVIF